jgi:UDP-N-acetylmuramoyl-tripeptide--D-alanyl-D-alanine ligase
MTIPELYKIFIENKQNISTDSRKITANCMFFALKGENFDGNTFALTALQQGAACCIVEDNTLPHHPKLIQVPDVLIALQQLATHHRRTYAIPIVGVAGSNGKTTTKELLHATLRTHYRTHATAGNLNNHIGVPLTLLAMPIDTQIAIIEIGANNPHEVMQLCQIAQPNYGIVTSIGKEHLEGFKDLETIIQTEGEMYDYVLTQNDGTIFIHQDDEILMQRAKNAAPNALKQAIFYGTQPTADCVGKLIDASLHLHIQWDTAAAALPAAPIVRTNMIGAYNFVNLLAAACIARYFSVPYHKINDALAAYTPANNRSQLLYISTNTVVLDAYNANPSSMKLAIENLSLHIQAQNKMPILGDMYELGAATDIEHQNILDLLEFYNFDNAILVGAYFYKQRNHIPHKQNYRFFDSVQTLRNQLPIGSFQDTFLMLKASRGIGLEKYLD